MKRTSPTFVVVAAVAVVLGVPALASAQGEPTPAPTPSPSPAPAPAAPTEEDLAAAKQAFDEGNALYKAGKLAEAVDKLKESFRLSRNAYLLYNIGHTYDQLGQHDMVLFYYRKFLANAPANAPMRANVEKRVAELAAQNVQEAAPDPQDTAEPVTSAPASKYSAKDFKHELVFTVPPNNPVDITAFVPQESGLSVRLFYRGGGDATFVSKPMTWRNMELVGRIPAPKVTGNSVQYYLEVRDPADKLVTRSGKSTVPNLVTIEQGAQPHYIADFVDEGGEVFVPPPPDEIPLAGTEPEGRSTALTAGKWIATGTTVALVGTSMVTYLLAGKQHDKLVADTRECGQPPCRAFDEEFGQKVEDLGQRYDTIYKVTLGIGVATAAVAGYLWYRDLTRKKQRDVSVTPVFSPDFTGAAAEARF